MPRKQQQVLIGVVGGLLSLGALAVEQLPEVVVEAAPPPLETRQVRTPTLALDRGLPADAAEALRSVTGVSGVRMGGHGIDPIIRGQTQTQLNVLLDGAYMHGGCPNRMDPPTAYSAMDTYDSVTVLKGFQSVLYGGGGSGGTVLLERTTPRLQEGEPVRGKASIGYKSNSDTRRLTADVTAGSPQGFGRGIGAYAKAGNYEDGDGNPVRSAYTTRSGTALLGWTPDDLSRLEASFEAVRLQDVLFAGAGMDSPKSDGDTYRIKFVQHGREGLLAGGAAEIYRSQVDHEMDNFSLRPLAEPMKMRVPTHSDTTGGRLQAAITPHSRGQGTLGVDYQRNERNADRFAGPPAAPEPTVLQSILWPEVELHLSGLFGEWQVPVGLTDLLTAGLRYDHVHSQASRVDEQTSTTAGIRTPNQLYQLYYGRRAEDHKEDNVSGFLSYEHDLREPDGGSLFGSLARSVRTADATERFLAANAGPASDGSFPRRWIGNPGLAPEKHWQAEVGISWSGSRWRWGASVFHDQVDDYILRDRAHGQPGILQNDNASIYRNVDARLWGAEAEGMVAWARNWSSRLALAYVEARNTTDSRWIAQIPPLEGSLSLDYRRSSWNLGTLLRFAAQQTKVDADSNTGSGQDAGETNGWAVVDLDGGWRLGKHVQLDFGVYNVFDTTYAYHVNRANVDPFNPEAVQVNEPGRELWLKASAYF